MNFPHRGQCLPRTFVFKTRPVESILPYFTNLSVSVLSLAYVRQDKGQCAVFLQVKHHDR
uniref:Ubiquitin-protein ligase n=1 Tax=Clytia hemisphaerica TaxID=252671 RepID=A0A069DMC1_9CNID